MEKKEMLYEGKAKKVYATDVEDVYIVDYKDDATAFNGEKKGTFFLVIQLSTYTLYFKAYTNFTFHEYPIRCLPIRNGCLFVRTPMPTRFRSDNYPF